MCVWHRGGPATQCHGSSSASIDTKSREKTKRTAVADPWEQVKLVAAADSIVDVRHSRRRPLLSHPTLNLSSSLSSSSTDELCLLRSLGSRLLPPTRRHCAASTSFSPFSSRARSLTIRSCERRASCCAPWLLDLQEHLPALLASPNVITVTAGPSRWSRRPLALFRNLQSKNAFPQLLPKAVALGARHTT